MCLFDVPCDSRVIYVVACVGDVWLGDVLSYNLHRYCLYPASSRHGIVFVLLGLGPNRISCRLLWTCVV